MLTSNYCGISSVDRKTKILCEYTFILKISYVLCLLKTGRFVGILGDMNQNDMSPPELQLMFKIHHI